MVCIGVLIRCRRFEKRRTGKMTGNVGERKEDGDVSDFESDGL